MVAVVLAWGEWTHALNALQQRRVLRGVQAGDGVVIVLGFQNRSARPNQVNRWRARLAVRTARTHATAASEVTIVCCGGAVRGSRSEAHHLADAVRGTGWTGAVVLEETSRTTWQNIAHARTLVGDPGWVSICSNGLHARKARAYLHRQDPALSGRLRPTLEYRFGEMIFAKPIFALVGLLKLRALRHKRR